MARKETEMDWEKVVKVAAVSVSVVAWAAAVVGVATLTDPGFVLVAVPSISLFFVLVSVPFIFILVSPLLGVGGVSRVALVVGNMFLASIYFTVVPLSADKAMVPLLLLFAVTFLAFLLAGKSRFAKTARVFLAVGIIIITAMFFIGGRERTLQILDKAWTGIAQTMHDVTRRVFTVRLPAPAPVPAPAPAPVPPHIPPVAPPPSAAVSQLLPAEKPVEVQPISATCGPERYLFSGVDRIRVIARPNCWSGWVRVPAGGVRYRISPDADIQIQYSDGALLNDGPGKINPVQNREAVFRFRAVGASAVVTVLIER